MDIDHVYTWVNSEDDSLTRLRSAHASKEVRDDFTYRAGAARCADNGELRSSIRNSLTFLPFIKNVYIFGSGARPDWLDDFGDRVIYIPQSSVIPDKLWPTFQSDTVESFIHEIPGLSERYIYSNDDFFFGSLHNASDFFTPEGKALVGLAQWPAANGSELTYRNMEENALKALKRIGNLPKYLNDIPPIWNGIRPRGRWHLLVLMMDYAVRRLPLLNAISHVSQPFIKSAWPSYKKTFYQEISNLQSNRFRSDTSFSVNFTYHYYLYGQGKVDFYYAPNHKLLLRSQSINARKKLKSDLLMSNSKVPRFCLNDMPAEPSDGWAAFIEDLLSSLERRSINTNKA